jgi:predicted DNA-binding transcriptional regulator YafY
MAATTERLLRVLAALQSGGTWTGSALADHLGVTVRTVRRDVERLRDLGYAVDADLGVTGGYRLGRAGRCLPPLTLDDEEAVVLAACLRAAAGGSMAAGGGTIEAILDRLEHMLPARASDHIGAVLATTTRLSGGTDATEQVRPAVLRVLTRACRERETVLITYRDARDRRSERRLEPLRIVSAGRRWYLAARDIDRDAWRTLRLDRIADARTTGHGYLLSDPPDPVELVRRAITVAPYRYEAVVELDAPLHRVASLVPPTVAVLEPLGEAATLMSTGGDDLDFLAFHLVRLRVPFRVRRPAVLRRRCGELAERLAAASRAPVRRR